MNYINIPPPIFKFHIPKLPAHIIQSENLQYLTCKTCSTTANLAYDPNYRGFLADHAHTVAAPGPPTTPKSKPWPESE